MTRGKKWLREGECRQGSPPEPLKAQLRHPDGTQSLSISGGPASGHSPHRDSALESMLQDKPTNSFFRDTHARTGMSTLKPTPNVQAQHQTGTVLENGCRGLQATMGLEGTENRWCPNFLKVEGLPGVSLCPPRPLSSEEGANRRTGAGPRALLQLSCPGPPPLGTTLLLALSCGHL